MYIGTKIRGGNWYYMDSSGASYSGWVQSGGSWCYTLSDERMLTDGWVFVIYDDSVGETFDNIVAGWNYEMRDLFELAEPNLNLTTYYLMPDGVMECNGAIDIYCVSHTFDASGVCTD